MLCCLTQSPKNSHAKRHNKTSQPVFERVSTLTLTASSRFHTGLTLTSVSTSVLAQCLKSARRARSGLILSIVQSS